MYIRGLSVIALLVMVVACAYHPYHFIITVVMGKWKGAGGDAWLGEGGNYR